MHRAHGLDEPSKITWAALGPQRGWNSLARELQAEEEQWRTGDAPQHRDIAYRTWLAWSRRKKRADQLRSVDDEVGLYLRRQVTEIDEFLASALPSLT